jgi:hypothetical protein
LTVPDAHRAGALPVGNLKQSGKIIAIHHSSEQLKSVSTGALMGHSWTEPSEGLYL